MSPPTTVTSTHLATLPVESFLYGVFVILFAISTTLFAYRYRSLCRMRQSTPASTRPILTLSFLIFFTITAHWVVSWIRFFAGFINVNDGTTPDLFFSEMRHVTQYLKSIFVLPSLLLADLAFIYRLWFVWGCSVRAVILPMLTMLGLLTSGLNIIIGYALFKPEDTAFIRRFNDWILSDLVFTISTNIYCTAMITWKIWSVSRETREFTGSNLLRVLSTIVESAALYTSWMIVIFVLSLARSPVGEVLIDSCPAIAGIAFMLINVRVGLGWAATQGSGGSAGSSQEGQFDITADRVQFALPSLNGSHTLSTEGGAASTLNYKPDDVGTGA